jgi:predicted nucleic acid-binding protein
VILVDSNVPMYLVGAAHPNKEAARQALEEAVAVGESLCTDAEVLQEILHRYVAIRRPKGIDPAFDVLLSIVDVVYPIERSDVERARRLLRTTPTLSARDAVHVAVMQGRDVDRIISFDLGFDGIPGLVRIGSRTGIRGR